jgi:drug/metabolite transporter (DMT)-like permease
MNRLRSSSPARGYLIALIATALWSMSAIFISYLTTHFQMPPLVLAFWRDLFVASAVCSALALLARPLLRLDRRHVRFFVLYGFVLAVFNAIWTVSVALNGAAVATVLNHTAPAFTALVGWHWWGERLDAPKVVAIVLCIARCTLVSGAYDPAAWQVNPIGIAAGLVAGVGFAMYSLLGKASSQRGINPWTATLVSFAIGASFLFLFQLRQLNALLWLSQPTPASEPGGGHGAALGWGALVLLAIGPTLGGYGLYTVSLTHLPASTASLIITLEPALTAIWAVLFLDERLTVPQFVGGGLILVGVALLRLDERASDVAGAHPQPSHQGPT